MRTGSLITNIIALVLMFPSVICSTICGAATGASMAMSSDDPTAAGAYIAIGTMVTWGTLFLGIISSIMGFISISKPKTTLAFITASLLILTGLGNLYQIVTANILGVIVGILYIVSGILLILNQDPGKSE